MTQAVPLACRPNRLAISPRARRALSRRAMDASTLRGSGPNGRIVEADVLRAVQFPQPQSQPPSAAPPSAAPQDALQVVAVSEAVAIPTLTLRAELDASALLAIHKRYSDYARREHGVEWTPADLILYVVARSLRAHPKANRIWREAAARDLPSVNVGIFGASEAQERAQVLAIRDAGRLNLVELARQRAALEAAPVLAAEPVAISVLSALEGCADEIALPIPCGQSAALGAGRITARPFVIDGALGVRPTLRLCLNLDTRIFSQALAGSFLQAVVERLEEPELLIFS